MKRNLAKGEVSFIACHIAFIAAFIEGVIEHMIQIQLFVLVKIPAFYLEHLGNDFPDLLRVVNAAAAAAVDKGF